MARDFSSSLVMKHEFMSMVCAGNKKILCSFYNLIHACMSLTSLNLFLHIINFLTMTNFPRVLSIVNSLIFFCRIPFVVFNSIVCTSFTPKHIMGKCCHISFWWSFRAIFSEKKSLTKQAMKAEIIIIENCFLYAQLWATNEREKKDVVEWRWRRKWMSKRFPFCMHVANRNCNFLHHSWSINFHISSLDFAGAHFFLHVMHSHTYGCIMNIAERQKITQSFNWKYSLSQSIFSINLSREKSKLLHESALRCVLVTFSSSTCKA